MVEIINFLRYAMTTLPEDGAPIWVTILGLCVWGVTGATLLMVVVGVVTVIGVVLWRLFSMLIDVVLLV